MPITGSLPVEHLLAVANSYHEPEARDEESADGQNWLPAHDHLETVESAIEFLGRNQIRLPDRPGARHLKEMKAIRVAARLLLTSERAYERRTSELLRTARLRLDAGGHLVPVRSGWDGFIDALLVSLVELREHADRLKVCDNEQCRWLFLDHSKNRSRQWCASASCGNRQRVRRFRERMAARA
jgi:CGNR zinc finger